jgi:predicted transcriptional regulator
MVVGSKPMDIIKNKELEPDFKPSTKTLLRILKTITDKGAEAKTTLSIYTHVNYTRLAKCIVWMEKKGLVESTIDKSRIKVGLTKKGKEFVSTLSNDI